MGHPVLRASTRVLAPADLRHPLTQKLIDDMIETMHEYHGVGLAAPQIHEGMRLFVALAHREFGTAANGRFSSHWLANAVAATMKSVTFSG